MTLFAKRVKNRVSGSDSTLAFADPRIALGARQPGRAGDGDNPRDTAEFETLEAHIRRLEAEGPAAVEWAEVARLATAFIETRGQDLVVACWLAYALSRLERYKGLATGLGLLREMIGRHWETMPPTRERARVGALEWLAGRAAMLCDVEPAEDEHAAILYAVEAAKEIERAVSDRLTRDSCSLGALILALAPRRDDVRRALAEAERQREEEAAKARLPVPAPPTKPAPPPVDHATVESLPETLRTLAAGMLTADLTDSRAYLLSRVASWWRIRQVPQNDKGRTHAMPPVEEAAALRDLCRTGRDGAALLALNDLVWTAPFWFEGHRIAAEILRRLGADHADAHAVVCAAMPLLFHRLPALMTLSFADGTPLVGAETRAWLAECGGSPADADQGLDRVRAEVRGLLAAGKGKEAVDRMAALTEGGGSGRDRLLRQIAQARFCLDVGLVAAALPLLDHLDHLLEAHGLESFEPTLAAQVAELRFHALTHADAFKLVPEERRRHGLDQTRQRLVRLDFATAARLFR